MICRCIGKKRLDKIQEYDLHLIVPGGRLHGLAIRSAFKFRGNQIHGRRHLIAAEKYDLTELIAGKVEIPVRNTHRNCVDCNRENGRESEEFAPDEDGRIALSSKNMQDSSVISTAYHRPRKNLGILAAGGAQIDSSRGSTPSSCGRFTPDSRPFLFLLDPLLFLLFLLFCVFSYLISLRSFR